jgi:hypothetical protein
MLRAAWRVALNLWMALGLAGCFVIGPIPLIAPASRAGPPAPPTPAVPQIELEYGGVSVAGAQTSYLWQSGVGSSSSASPSALTLPAGAALNIVVRYASPPAALWVLELDAGQAPRSAVSLIPIASVTAYAPTMSGAYSLQVIAEWTAQAMVTTVFALNVLPPP